MQVYPHKRVTVAMAFVRMPTPQSPQSRGRLGEDPAYTYFRCMAVAYGSVRRFNPGVELALVTTEPLPEPYAQQLAAIGVETVLAPFTHRPPEDFGRGWASSLFHLDAMAALAGRGHTLVFIDPDVLCVRPLDAVLVAAGDAAGVQTEFDALHAPEDEPMLLEYEKICGEMHRELGEETVRHGVFGGYFYVLPPPLLPALLDRIDRAWSLALDRHARGKSVFYTDEHFMNYALRAVEVVEMSAYVRVIGTAPWRRMVTDRETVLGLTLWHLIHEKDLGFQQLYRDAVDPASWFWTASPDEFRERAGAITSATRRSPQRALLNCTGDLIEKLTTERMQHRLKPLFTRMVQLYSSMRMA
ncbi:hypothetical protein AB0M41_09265 [Streptomyces sp. NPDC051896]|uniref:hypothetical protein n=1 Tax=Streptomyces sp. NPDC051896 TaxID=3155416 RepID=UPI003442A903